MSGQSSSLAYIGLGSNIGDGPAILLQAWQYLSGIPDIRCLSLSSPYLTSPVHMESPHWFTNAVGCFQTVLSPQSLLAMLLEVERAFGRDRSQGVDRSLDLDLLAYGDQVIDEPGLTLPHPELHHRLFVLVPLAELAPAWVHPVLQRSVAQLLGDIDAQEQQITLTTWPA